MPDMCAISDVLEVIFKKEEEIKKMNLIVHFSYSIVSKMLLFSCIISKNVTNEVICIYL